MNPQQTSPLETGGPGAALHSRNAQHGVSSAGTEGRGGEGRSTGRQRGSPGLGFRPTLLLTRSLSSGRSWSLSKPGLQSCKMGRLDPMIPKRPPTHIGKGHLSVKRTLGVTQTSWSPVPSTIGMWPGANGTSARSGSWCVNWGWIREQGCEDWERSSENACSTMPCPW